MDVLEGELKWKSKQMPLSKCIGGNEHVDAVQDSSKRQIRDTSVKKTAEPRLLKMLGRFRQLGDKLKKILKNQPSWLSRGSHLNLNTITFRSFEDTSSPNEKRWLWVRARGFRTFDKQQRLKIYKNPHHFWNVLLVLMALCRLIR